MTKFHVEHVADHTFDVTVPLHDTDNEGHNFTKGHHTVHVNLHKVAHDDNAPHGHLIFDLAFSSPGLIAADLTFASYRHDQEQTSIPFSINGPNQTVRVYARPHTADHCVVRIRLDDASDATHHKKSHH